MAEVEIICIGNIVADCVSRVVSKMPEKGRAVYVQSVGLYGGGSAPNAGYALAKFGFQVAVVGRVVVQLSSTVPPAATFTGPLT